MKLQTNQHILEQVIEDARAAAKAQSPQVIVFDLDSTLFEVTPRTQCILNEFIESEHLENAEELRRSLKSVTVQVDDHGLEQALRRSGIALHDENLKKHLIQFWRERFFSNKYLELDIPFAGAAEYVGELHGLGAHIYYLTGRDRIRMGSGTPAQLKKWKFPLEIERAELIMKPQRGMDDAEFKVSELKKIKDVHWLFENEPKIIHQVEAELPGLKIIFFDSSHSGKADPKSEWTRIRDFKR